MVGKALLSFRVTCLIHTDATFESSSFASMSASRVTIRLVHQDLEVFFGQISVMFAKNACQNQVLRTRERQTLLGSLLV